ncbi:hypothetical protein ON010_g10037 [Phytophthora cinnamomi]|nr:hypothetical protein ON010_g10037 [Phytophthora cinnamomi]
MRSKTATSAATTAIPTFQASIIDSNGDVLTVLGSPGDSPVTVANSTAWSSSTEERVENTVPETQAAST